MKKTISKKIKRGLKKLPVAGARGGRWVYKATNRSSGPENEDSQSKKKKVVKRAKLRKRPLSSSPAKPRRKKKTSNLF